MPEIPSNPELLAEARFLAATGEAKRIREAAHFSLHDVARQTGVKHPTVSRWENGLRKPTGEAAMRYATLLRTLRKAISQATIADIRAAAEAKADREAERAASRVTHTPTAVAQ